MKVQVSVYICSNVRNIVPLEVVNGLQHSQAVCPTVKYRRYMWGGGDMVRQWITSCPKCSEVFRVPPTEDWMKCYYVCRYFEKNVSERQIYPYNMHVTIRASNDTILFHL